MKQEVLQYMKEHLKEFNPVAIQKILQKILILVFGWEMCVALAEYYAEKLWFQYITYNCLEIISVRIIIGHSSCKGCLLQNNARGITIWMNFSLCHFRFCFTRFDLADDILLLLRLTTKVLWPLTTGSTEVSACQTPSPWLNAPPPSTQTTPYMLTLEYSFLYWMLNFYNERCMTMASSLSTYLHQLPSALDPVFIQSLLSCALTIFSYIDFPP